MSNPVTSWNQTCARDLSSWENVYELKKSNFTASLLVRAVRQALTWAVIASPNRSMRA